MQLPVIDKVSIIGCRCVDNWFSQRAPRKDYIPVRMGKAIKVVRKGEKVAVAPKKIGVS